MVFDLKETKEIENLKQSNKIEYEKLRHKNAMEELEKQLEIAKEGAK